MKTVIFSALILLAQSALADQCAYVTREQANAAWNVIVHSKKVHTLCELCGEKIPKEVFVQSVDVKRVGYVENGVVYYGLYLDNKLHDLAYTYADGKNVAIAVGCPAVEVSPEISAK